MSMKSMIVGSMLVLLASTCLDAGRTAQANDNPALGIGEPTTDPCGEGQCCGDPNCCEDPPCCPQPPCDCSGSGSPINAKFGNAEIPFIDLLFRVGDIEFTIQRTYTSDDIYIGSFGRGMTSTLDQLSISTFNGGTDHELVVVRSPGGQRYEYLRQPDLSYTGPVGHYDTLQKMGSFFFLTNEDGDIWTFDALDGTLLTKEDRYGHTVSFFYNANGQPTSIQLFPGKSITINYGPNGLVESMTDFGGRVVSYEYDTEGLLTQFNDAESYDWTYGYSPEGKMTSVVNGLGQQEVAIAYNAQGRVQTMVDADGDYTYTYFSGSTRRRDNALSTLHGVDVNETMFYDSQGVITRVNHADGSQSQFLYDSAFTVTSKTDPDTYVEQYQYDSTGRVTHITYPDATTKSFSYHPTLDLKTSETNERGFTTLWEYDSAGNLTRQVAASGTPSEQVSTWEYDGAGHMTRTVDPAGLETLMAYDSFGQMTQQVITGTITLTYEYDLLGNMTRAADHTGNQVLMAYDNFLRPVMITDAAGNVSTRGYDAGGRLANADDQITGQSATLYNAFGLPTQETDGRGDSIFREYTGVYMTRITDDLKREVLYEYDVTGNLTKITRVSALGDRVTNLDTDPVGKETSRTGANGITETRTYDIRRRLASVSRSDGLMQTFLYDGVGNQTQTTDFWGNTVVRVYDALDRMVTETDDYGTRFTHSYDSGGRLTQTVLPRGTRTYEYDALGRETRFVDADGSATTYEYDVLNRRTGVVRPAGAGTTEFDVDGASRPLAITRPSTRQTSWTYDGFFYPATHTEDGGRVTQFEYDGNFAVTKMTLPDGAEYAFAYDAGDRLTARTLPSGDTINAEYDDFNRRTKIAYPDLTETNVTYNNSDLVESVTSTNGGTVTFGFDSIGRVTSQAYNGRTVQYAYSTDYKTVTMTYPSGLVVVKELDTLLRTDSITIGGETTPIIDYTYAADGVPASAAYGSGVTATYTFTGERFIQGISYNDSVPNLVRGWSRGINDLGSTTHIERLDDPTQSSQILRDAEDRVTGKLTGTLDGSNTVPAPTRTESWSLDGLGNWNSYSLNGAAETRLHDLNNRITQRNAGAAVPMVYDANGNITDDGDFLYAYNLDGLVTEVRRKSDNALVESYGYDPLNRLAAISTGSGDLIEFVRDLEDRVLEVYVNSALLSSHIHGGQFDEQVAAIINGTRYYYLLDLGQNIAAATDASGNLVESYEYDTYGTPRFFDGTGTPIAQSAIGNMFLFSGRLYRQEANLYYYRARYMSATLGRFLSPDPMGFNTSYTANLYEYAESSPIDLGDPYGLCTGCVSTDLSKSGTAFKTKRLSGKLPWSVEVKLTVKGGVKICRKCCKGGKVCGASVSGSISIMGSGSATFDVTPPIGGIAWMLFKAVWDTAGGKIGLYVVVSGSYGFNKEWKYDTCTGEGSSKFCAKVEIKADLQGGASTPEIGGCSASLWAYGGGSYSYSCCNSSDGSSKCSHCVQGKIGVKGNIKCKYLSGWFGGVNLTDSFDIVIWNPKSSGCG